MVKDINLHKHQQEIASQIIDKILHGCHKGWISLPNGIGVNFILINIVELLFDKQQIKNALFLTNTINEKEQLISLYSKFGHKYNITFNNYQKYIKNKNTIKGFDCIVCKSAEHTPEYLYIPLSRLTKTIEILSLLRNNTNNVSVLVVFGTVANVDKKQIFLDYGVTLWDISNLLFYIKDNPTLQYHLTKILPFSIASIEPEQSSGWMPTYPNESKTILAAPPTGKIDLKERLINCKHEKKASAEYESICSDIIEYLFDDEFSITDKQHNSADKLFRMDLICSLKGNSEFWKLLIQHYNSRFIVFEYKNYNKQLDQNLIYITEKYLFNTALRNVAIIISRKGFSENAEAAARGCLKENGKLIIDITDNDLIQMIDIKDDGEEPADYLLNKLEKYLMSFSK